MKFFLPIKIFLPWFFVAGLALSSLALVYNAYKMDSDIARARDADFKAASDAEYENLMHPGGRLLRPVANDGPAVIDAATGWTPEMLKRFDEDCKAQEEARRQYRVAELREKIKDMDKYIAGGDPVRPDTLEAILQERAKIAAGLKR